MYKKIKKLALLTMVFCLLASLLFMPKDHVKAYGPIIVLDPGHGGTDSGAVAGSYYEKNLNLNLAKKIKTYLSSFSSNVILTRESDVSLSLGQRVTFANNLKADLFVSIHHDSSTNKSANGISTHYSSYRAKLDTKDVYVSYKGKRYPYVKESGGVFYYKDNGTVKSVSVNNATAYDPTPTTAAQKSRDLSLKLADTLAGMGYKRMYTSTGSWDHNLYVTRHTTMPSVLIENGFVSNSKELAKISNPKVIEETAKRIANTIINYFGGTAGVAKISKIYFDKTSPQLPGSQINLYANSNFEGNLFRFWLFEDGVWKVVQDYSTKNYYSWKPSKAGKYKFSIHVKSPNSSKEYDDYKAAEFTVQPIIFNYVESSLSSPQKAGTPIELTANATGGQKLLYQFHVFDGTEWKSLTDYTESNKFLWIPEKSGSYKVSVYVKEASSENKYDYYKTLDYNIVDRVRIIDVRSSLQSPQIVKTPISFTTETDGGTNNLYKYFVYDGTQWKILRDYNSSPTVEWVPEKPGDYRFSVHVKEAASQREYDSYRGFEYKVKNPISISADKPSPQQANSEIRVTASSPLKDMLYKFLLEREGKQQVLRDFSSSSSIVWKPSDGGEYKLIVQAVRSGQSQGGEFEYTESMPFTIKVNAVKVQSLTANVPSPQPSGKSIKLTANATGGTEKLYKFFVYDGKQWKVLRDYQTSNTCTWIPAAGKYKLVVHVKDRSSQKSYDSLALIENYQIVQAPVKLEKINVSLVSPQVLGASVKLTAMGTGGATRLYKFNVYDGKQWIVLRNYSTNNTYTWTPSKAGKYKFSIHVKDSRSTKAYDAYRTFDYVIAAPVKMVKVETDKVSPQAINTAINIRAMATGGTTKLYKFHIFENNIWKVVQDYSPSNQYLWKPQKAGEYKISVHVKDQNSSKSYDSYSALLYIIQ